MDTAVADMAILEYRYNNTRVAGKLVQGSGCIPVPVLNTGRYCNMEHTGGMEFGTTNFSKLEYS